MPGAQLDELVKLRRVRDRMDREFALPLNVETLAEGVFMSAGHLSRQFKLAYGKSPYAYLMTRRIERAKALLQRGDLSVTEVCFEVECSSLGTFRLHISLTSTNEVSTTGRKSHWSGHQRMSWTVTSTSTPAHC